MKKTIILFLVLTFFVSGCGKKEEVKPKVVKEEKQIEEKIKKEEVEKVVGKIEEQISTFKNNNLGYELQYEKPWRLSNVLSKKYAVLRYAGAQLVKIDCAPDFLEEENPTEDCFKNHPLKDEMEKELDEFIANWDSSDSDIIIFTDWSDEEEALFIKQVNDGVKSWSDLDFDKEITSRIVMIYPSDGILSFKEEKPGMKEFVYLQQNVKAYKHDLRDMSMAMLVHVPHVKTVDIGFDKMEMKSLIFKANVKKGSVSESLFYKMLDSYISNDSSVSNENID